jgi:hypothetical protein
MSEAKAADPREVLALRYGQIYRQERTDEEIRSPGLSAQAQALLANDPRVYGSCVELLLDGCTSTAIAGRLDLDLSLVKFLARQHQEIRAIRRKVVVGNLEESILSLSTRLSDEAHEIPMRDVARTLSTAVDKLATLTGNAATTVEIRHHASREQVLAMYDELKRKEADVSSNDRDPTEKESINDGT